MVRITAEHESSGGLHWGVEDGGSHSIWKRERERFKSRAPLGVTGPTETLLPY